MGVQAPDDPPDPRFRELLNFLCRLPSIQLNDSPSRGIGSRFGEAVWWAKFSLDIKHPLAWSTVQELGHVLNYLSVQDQLPTVFKPVSPPPYLNGGPLDCLSWVIECPVTMSPADVAKWLEGRLPRPVEDVTQWSNDDEL
jgi:hypothetical protein